VVALRPLRRGGCARRGSRRGRERTKRRRRGKKDVPGSDKAPLMRAFRSHNTANAPGRNRTSARGLGTRALLCTRASSDGVYRRSSASMRQRTRQSPDGVAVTRKDEKTRLVQQRRRRFQ
jgi:hypothetical protein